MRDPGPHGEASGCGLDRAEVGAATAGSVAPAGAESKPLYHLRTQTRLNLLCGWREGEVPTDNSIIGKHRSCGASITPQLLCRDFRAIVGSNVLESSVDDVTKR